LKAFKWHLHGALARLPIEKLHSVFSTIFSKLYCNFFIQKKCICLKFPRTGISSIPGVTNMRPAKEFRAAREAFRRDQQSWTFAFRRDQQSWTDRFHSM